jgi:NAD(P)-dependent dehydrogenase (short-subunit alcohol dehydrogenase family)
MAEEIHRATRQEQAEVTRRQFGAGMAGVATAILSASAVAAALPAAALSPATQPAGILGGRVAFITGAARGIGRAIAVAMAAQGADIVAFDIAAQASPITEYAPATPNDLAETGRQVEAQGRKYLSIVGDQRDIGALRTAADKVMQEFGRIDIVVIDAAIQVFKPLIEMNDAQWHDVIDVNLNGTANVIRAFGPILVKQGRGGRIITLASMQGRHGFKDGSSYSASKWGIIGLTKSAALELGKYKITVNAVIPGLVDTALTRNMPRWKEAMKDIDPKFSGEPTEQQVIEAQLTHAPLGVPWLQSEDIAPAAVFLASDMAALVTGACYDVTAGDDAHNT